MKKDKTILLLLVLGAIALLAFKNAGKKKGSVIVDIPTGSNLYVLANTDIYDGNGNTIFTPSINYLVAQMADLGEKYQISFVLPDGTATTGYVDKINTTIK